jgi:subtilase family serine protease
MQVTIDYTDVLDENNELDNTAVRPFVNGNYQVAGRIIVQSAVSPATSYANQYTYLSLSGRAWYTDLAVQLTDSTVAGATVEFTVTETGETYSGYTNSWGYFNIYFPAPDTPGLYHITGSVTDFTLTRNFTNEFTILTPIIPETKPNLTLNYCHSVDVQPVNPHTAASVTLVAHVSNNGNATATGPIEVLFSYSTGETFLGTYAGNLNANQSVNVSVTAPTPAPTTTVLTALADPNNTIAEWTETFADNSSTDNMCYDFQPVGICGGNFWGQHCVNTSTGIYVGLNSYHLYDASPVDVLFEVSGPGISGWQNLGTGTLNNVTRNCYCPYVVGLPNPYTFAEVGIYTFRMTVDPNNVYPECSEANNVLVVTVNSVTCTPPETKPNLAFAYCYGLQVTPVNPTFPGMANLVANITNNGNATAFGPIDVEFTYSAGTYTGTYAGNLTPGQSAAVTVAAPLPVPATTILTAVIDPANTVVEWNEIDNTTSDNMCWEFQPVPHCGTNFWSRTYLVGQSASLSVGLNVQHLYDANPVKVKFEVSGPGIAGVVNLGNGILNNVTRNCWCPWSVSLTSPFTFFEAGTYHFKMTADPNDDYTECDETNNILEVDVVVMNGADMRILSQFINPNYLNPGVGDSVSLIVSYENIGNSNVDDIMKLRVNVDEVFLDEVYPVPGLATGDHASFAIPTKWASDLPGAHVIRAIIDYDHQVPEINESNNEATRAIIVGESANLYFQLFASSNSSPNVNDYININARIGNNGDVDATANVKFYFINDSGDTISVGQTPISVTAHDSTSIVMPWTVLDPSTTLVGKIVDVNV